MGGGGGIVNQRYKTLGFTGTKQIELEKNCGKMKYASKHAVSTAAAPSI